MKRFIMFPLALALLALTSCASVFSDSTYPVKVDSGESYEVYVEIQDEDGELAWSDTTPFTAMLDAGSGYFDGETYTFVGPTGNRTVMKSGVDGWYIGTILLTPFIGGLIIDPITGAMYTLPERITVK